MILIKLVVFYYQVEQNLIKNQYRVLTKSNKNILLSSRKLQKTKVVLASELNTYDVVSTNKLMMMESSIKELEKIYKR